MPWIRACRSVGVSSPDAAALVWAVAQVGADLAPYLGRLVALLVVERGDAGHDLLQPWQALALLRGEVRGATERRAVWGEEHGQGPAPAATVQGCMGVLIARIDVRALVAVDFDGHEVLVDQRCNGGVFITLAVHDVTPMTPDSPDVEPDGPIERCRQRERPGSPLLPRHGLLRRGTQIGARRSGQIVSECGRRGSLGPRARAVGGEQSSSQAETNNHY